MHFLRYIMIVGYCLRLSTSVPVKESVPEYYEKLVSYAKLASVAYCLDFGLSEGELGTESSGCTLPICLEPEFESIKILKLFDSNKWGQIGSGFYAVDHDTKRILLVFRGTYTRRDYVSDLDFKPVAYTPLEVISKKDDRDCEGCKVHRGFYKYLKRNCEKIIENLEILMDEHEDYQLVIVGHSLGAALAILTGIEFQLMGHDPLIISYAGPKIGNQKYVDYVNSLFDIESVTERIENENFIESGIIRVVHKGDFVPALPPSPLFQTDGYEFTIEKKELPHLPTDVMLKGPHFEGISPSFRESRSPNELWSSLIRSYEHAHYFVRITGCGESY
ncbi:alpha/beta-hydrolase [Suhomyces tanzawaensis NRRL Y-17324]|uniref:triacylglycerol lipase n=1 Tax=Suhomyces tanzawaensis NRRL Y-17324 TaxID=984487 RepID=A0A1E4SQH4_9ASCO|nr:alpha/beta-hydrolase [Suhomyces tanzawaensis NRRL Y-17324]ODV81687.1 alpha/beta-hydrolase [Suhomyces tanzawaensis NRRL Y-17324]